jgi:hypothetical protein
MLINQVHDLVTSRVLNKGNGDSLIDKLNAANRNLNTGHKKPAVEELKAFINEVNAFKKARKLTSAQAQPLLDEASIIIASVGL